MTSFPPGVDDDVVLDVLYAEAAVDDLPLRHGHVVVVHLGVVHLAVDVQGVGGLAQHQLHLGKGAPPNASVPGRKKQTNRLKQTYNV